MECKTYGNIGLFYRSLLQSKPLNWRGRIMHGSPNIYEINSSTTPLSHCTTTIRRPNSIYYRSAPFTVVGRRIKQFMEMFHYVINLLPSPPRLCLRTTCWKIHHAQWIQCCKFCAAHQSSLAAGAGVIKRMANSIGPRNHYPWLDNGLFKKPGHIYSLGCCCSNLVMFFYRYTLWLRSSRKRYFFPWFIY